MRRLKEEGTEKEKISTEVALLLKLKAELAAVQGINLSAGSKDKKKAKKGGGKGKGENANKNATTSASSAAAPTSTLPINEEETNRLQGMVTQQVCPIGHRQGCCYFRLLLIN